MGDIVQGRPRKRKISIAAGLAVLIGLAANIATQLLADPDGPWVWVGVVIQAVATVVLLTCLVRFVRIQRDDYWIERGRDPKHPERPAA